MFLFQIESSSIKKKQKQKQKKKKGRPPGCPGVLSLTVGSGRETLSFWTSERNKRQLRGLGSAGVQGAPITLLDQWLSDSCELVQTDRRVRGTESAPNDSPPSVNRSLEEQQELHMPVPVAVQHLTLILWTFIGQNISLQFGSVFSSSAL